MVYNGFDCVVGVIYAQISLLLLYFFVCVEVHLQAENFSYHSTLYVNIVQMPCHDISLQTAMASVNYCELLFLAYVNYVFCSHGGKTFLGLLVADAVK